MSAPTGTYEGQKQAGRNRFMIPVSLQVLLPSSKYLLRHIFASLPGFPLFVVMPCYSGIIANCSLQKRGKLYYANIF